MENIKEMSIEDILNSKKEINVKVIGRVYGTTTIFYQDDINMIMRMEAYALLKEKDKLIKIEIKNDPESESFFSYEPVQKRITLLKAAEQMEKEVTITGIYSPSPNPKNTNFNTIYVKKVEFEGFQE
jgi:hypothetical protein